MSFHSVTINEIGDAGDEAAIESRDATKMRVLLSTYSDRYGRHVLATSVLLAAGIGLVTSLIAPHALPAKEYVALTLALSSSQLLSNISTEWLRVSIIRHAGSAEGEQGEKIQSILSLYTIIVSTLICVGSIICFLSLRYSSIQIIGVTIFSAAAQAGFDARSAFARAQFDNARLSLALMLRSTAMLFLVCGLCWLTGRAVYGVVGLFLSFPLAALAFGDRPSSVRMRLKCPKSAVIELARFGLGAAVGTNISLAVPVAARSFIVAALGGQAGGALFALEVGQRAFSTLGQSFSNLQLQTLIRAFDREGGSASAAIIRQSAVMSFYLFSFAAMVLIYFANSYAFIIIPPELRGSFEALGPVIFIFLALIAWRQYSVDAILFVAKRPYYMILPPIAVLVSIGAAVCGGAYLSSLLLNPVWLLVLGGAASCVFSIVLVQRAIAGAMPLLSLACAATSSCLAILLALHLSEARGLSHVASGFVLSVLLFGPAPLVTFGLTAKRGEVSKVLRWSKRADVRKL